MTTIYLIRHAEAEGNLYRRIQGHYNSLLTPNAYQQIRALQKRFEPIPVDAVYSSDLFRTMTTARAIYIPKNLPLHTRSDLREIHMGQWEDSTWAGIDLQHHEMMTLFAKSSPDFQAPGGESFQMLRDRGMHALRDIAAHHPNQTVAVFAHGTLIRHILSGFLDMPIQDTNILPHSDNTAVTCLEMEGEEVRVVFSNDSSHLTEDISTLARQKWWRKDGGQDLNLWYRPLDWSAERAAYEAAREEAWASIHPGLPYDPQGYLRDAQTCLAQSPWGVTAAMTGKNTLVGLLQLDQETYADQGAGYIPFCYILPEYRYQGLGVQLIGQAISRFRPLGLDKLRLRCAPSNDCAQGFYAKYGFLPIGQAGTPEVPLDLLEKYIGYDYRGELD